MEHEVMGLEKILQTKDFGGRRRFIEEYGNKKFLVWLQEEAFFNYCQVNGMTCIPFYKIRRELSKYSQLEIVDVGADMAADDWIKLNEKDEPFKEEDAEYLCLEWGTEIETEVIELRNQR